MTKADPYRYPGSTVYRNKLDIRDADTLEEFERSAFAVRYETLPRNLPITANGYRAIHRHLMQDVYDWAGEFRTLNILRTGPFCKVDYIPGELGKRFAAIADENNLRDLPPQRFADRAAEHLGEINAVHPFMDGNGRTLRCFLQILGAQAGHSVDLTRIRPAEWNSASIVSFHTTDSKPLAAIVLETITPAWLLSWTSAEPRAVVEPNTPELDRDDDLGL